MIPDELDDAVGTFSFPFTDRPDPSDASAIVDAMERTAADSRASIAAVESMIVDAIAACASQCSDVLSGCKDCIEGEIQRRIEAATGFVRAVDDRIAAVIQKLAGEAYGRAEVASQALSGGTPGATGGPVDGRASAGGGDDAVVPAQPTATVDPVAAGERFRAMVREIEERGIDAGDDVRVMIPELAGPSAGPGGATFPPVFTPGDKRTRLQEEYLAQFAGGGGRADAGGSLEGFGIDTTPLIGQGGGGTGGTTPGGGTVTAPPTQSYCISKGYYPGSEKYPGVGTPLPGGGGIGPGPGGCGYIPKCQECPDLVGLCPPPPQPVDPLTGKPAECKIMPCTGGGFRYECPRPPASTDQPPAKCGPVCPDPLPPDARLFDGGGCGADQAAGGAEQVGAGFVITAEPVVAPDLTGAGLEAVPLAGGGKPVVPAILGNLPPGVAVGGVCVPAKAPPDYCDIDRPESIRAGFAGYRAAGSFGALLSDPWGTITGLVANLAEGKGSWSSLGYIGRAVALLPVALVGAGLGAAVTVLKGVAQLFPLPGRCRDVGASLAITFATVTRFIGGKLGLLPAPIVAAVDYQANQACQYIIPSADAWTQARIAGVINDDQWRLGVEMNGVCPEWQAMILESGRPNPSFQMVFGFWRAGIIDANKRDAMLSRLGIEGAERIGFFQLATEAIPGPSDLLRMMVRDAADPQAVAEGRLDDDFDVKFQGELRDWAARQNVPEEVFRYYWRAHWQLPSPTQLYEMLHRLRPDAGVVDSQGQPLVVTTRDVLNALKVNDYAPAWVEKLTAISYRPLTVRDIARAYETGVITAEQAIGRFMDLGYTRSDAEVRVRFMVIDSAERRAEYLGLTDPAKARKDFIDGVIDAADYRNVLFDAGLTVPVIEERVASAQRAAAAARRRVVMAALRKRFLAGGLDTDQYRAELQRAGVSVVQAGSIVDRDSIVRASRFTELSIARMCKLVSQGYLTVDEYQRRAVNLGYTPADALRLVGSCLQDIAEANAAAVEAAIRKARAEADKAAAKEERRKREEARRIKAQWPCKKAPKPTCPPGVPEPPDPATV